MSEFNAPESFYAPKSTKLSEIRILLSKEEVDKAEEKLINACADGNEAEWNFLMGSILYKRHKYSDAYIYLCAAANLEKDNNEYHAALQQIVRQNGSGGFFGNLFGKK